MTRVSGLRLRGILDSRAQVTVEADLAFTDGVTGRGSAPRAIAPGRRERGRRADNTLGSFEHTGLVAELDRSLVGQPAGPQAEFDLLLRELDATGSLGSDVTVALSVAFARAGAARQGRSLHEYLAAAAGTVPGVPRLLVNVFSGGIHHAGEPDGFQQVMLVPETAGLIDDVGLALDVFAVATELATRDHGAPRLSASSGMLIPADSATQVALLREAIERAGRVGQCSIGVDVAAEHMCVAPGRYRFAGAVLEAGAFADRLAELAGGVVPMSYLEDPYDPADDDAWLKLPARLPPGTTVYGDDLFATDAARIDPALAGGILLKPTQAGTVTGALSAARTAQTAGMRLAVSHRSGETGDTAMCDLAVAVGAGLIKVGGPRRGDRLNQYNQLLRLAEAVAERTSPLT
ncbi:hypothetical protein AB0C29_03045 [Actinoplanes sp. NPDC048791]|uniref:hypothetical protein n=1 Tax=Actinoplanes sp. NPDC048791 TaxID=3154623 RepID=UPI0033E3E39B